MTGMHVAVASVFAGLFLVAASLFFLLLWASPAVWYVTAPKYFYTSLSHFLQDPWPRTLYLGYENTLAWAYLFVGFGLLQKRERAYRDLKLILSIHLIERASTALWFAWKFKGPPDARLAFGLILLGASLLWTWFGPFRRAFAPSREEKQETRIQEGIPSFEGIPISLAQPVVPETQPSPPEKKIVPLFLRGFENLFPAALVASGIALSLRWGLAPVQIALFGTVWGLASYLAFLYVFRAAKVPFLFGSIAMLLTHAAFLTASRGGLLLRLPPEAQHMVAQFVGGMIAGLFASSRAWFHGSSAGWVWMLGQTVYGLLRWKTGGEAMSWPALCSLGSLFFLGGTKALIASAAGGTLGGMLRRLARRKIKPPTTPVSENK
jgi:hypothetical protein